jgi:hypothetical protein
MKKTKHLSSQERDRFCSLDMADRLIRVEQRVSASFGRPTLYRETNYYKSLNANQRKELDIFLKRKKMNKLFLLFLITVPLLGFVFLGKGLTGYAVLDSAPQSFMIQSVLGLISLVSAVTLIFLIASKSIKDKKYNSYTSIIDNLIASKSVIRKHKKVFK